MYRQGDLLFVKCEAVPDGAKQQVDGIVAYGEVTGHKHRIRPGVEAVLMLLAGVSYIRVLKKEAPIDHEEHDTITLPIGDWIVKRQREYTPNGFRQVAD